MWHIFNFRDQLFTDYNYLSALEIIPLPDPISITEKLIISTLNVITQHPVLKIKLGQKRQIKCF